MSTIKMLLLWLLILFHCRNSLKGRMRKWIIFMLRFISHQMFEKLYTGRWSFWVEFIIFVFKRERFHKSIYVFTMLLFLFNVSHHHKVMSQQKKSHLLNFGFSFTLKNCTVVKVIIQLSWISWIIWLFQYIIKTDNCTLNKLMLFCFNNWIINNGN